MAAQSSKRPPSPVRALIAKTMGQTATSTVQSVPQRQQCAATERKQFFDDEDTIHVGPAPTARGRTRANFYPGFHPAHIGYALSAARLGYDMYKGYKSHKGRGRKKDMKIDDETKYISVVGRAPQGGKVSRRYQQQVNLQNTAAATSSAAYSVGLRTTGAAYAGMNLNLYLGRAIFGTGTLLASFEDFAAEATHFCDVFKWMTIKSIQLEFIPVTDAVVTDNWEVSDQSIQSDAGIVRYTKWNGDDTIANSTTGVVAYDVTNFTRFPHKTWEPLGKKIGMLCIKPNEIDQTNQQFGTDYISYDKARSMDNVTVGSAAVEYPFYGLMLQWEHQNLAANLGKFVFVNRVTVEVQWNTIKDDSLQAAAKQAAYNQARDLSDQPIPVTGPEIPVSYYPKQEINPDFEPEYQKILAKRHVKKAQ